MRRAFVLLVLFGLLGNSAVRAAAPNEQIGIGSVLQIRIVTPTGLRQNEIYRVDGLGFITHPLVGKVRIVELTPTQAESILERLLIDSGMAEPVVRVFVLEPGEVVVPVKPTFRIDGAVRKPGIYDLPGPTNLRQAIEAAGGLTSQSEDRLVRIKRKLTTTQSLRLSNDGDFVVKAGDEIVVLQESFR